MLHSNMICLNMIVKNEAHVISRCLESARPHIGRWCIVDTGSTDGTQAKIRELMAGIPGELHERPWVNFAHNRTEALELAKSGGGGYALFLDADDVLHVDSDSCDIRHNGADAYHLEIRSNGCIENVYWRTGIINLEKRWKWTGVVHEYLECADPFKLDRMHGWVVHTMNDSARNRDGLKKYLRDAAVLESALIDDPSNVRYVFYLAQSYRDARCHDRALYFYRKRATMGGFEEEAWYALYQVACMHEVLGHVDDALLGYLAAFDRRPSRAEPLYAAAKLARREKRWGAALVFSRTAMGIKVPERDVLFINKSMYEWRALDEYAVAASWTNHMPDAIRVFDSILLCPSLPDADRSRIESNLAHCKKHT